MRVDQIHGIAFRLYTEHLGLSLEQVTTILGLATKTVQQKERGTNGVMYKPRMYTSWRRPQRQTRRSSLTL